MHAISKWALSLVCLLCCASCSVLQRSSNKALSDGIYEARLNGARQKVYVSLSDDDIVLHKVSEGKIDSATAYTFSKLDRDAALKGQISFSKSSFDLDLFTLPVKFRPAQKNVPAQINTNINGAAYAGIRRDFYYIRYKKGALKPADRALNHYGYSIGLAAGLGNTFMSPTNTDGAINQEYDGIVFMTGVAFIVAVNNFNMGILAAQDRLTDHNRSVWIYNGKPYLGLAFGINLN